MALHTANSNDIDPSDTISFAPIICGSENEDQPRSGLNDFLDGQPHSFWEEAIQSLPSSSSGVFAIMIGASTFRK
ncbi:hypothetical protein KIN20_019404 [Parelaphostrongylus tenuis]|uniref:Uncharacterized protein n=1 Tax=Parelaphostrongylus tenuis TaxID=148309 RepID=A0AAD5MRJ2_PARTN|nr:hypothetical protein KIN20_019404 [Parelaphostrongylus tenuis]